MNSHVRAQIYEILSIDGPLMSRTFDADLRIISQIQELFSLQQAELLAVAQNVTILDVGKISPLVKKSGIILEIIESKKRETSSKQRDSRNILYIYNNYTFREITYNFIY